MMKEGDDARMTIPKKSSKCINQGKHIYPSDRRDRKCIKCGYERSINKYGT